ncbi:GNAT family protein [Vibrio sp. qd031]|uniref:GNAT family N-acetyltransferase n=1 Tax=Vibrio sp. qd031 TaxID=1603038 RepID=UPI000A111B4E|nr:GNAT family protein [Vibrio sp. qd031]
MKIFTDRLMLRNFCLDDLPHYLAMTASESYQRYYPDEQCSAAFGTQLVNSFIDESQQWPRLRFHMAICHSQHDCWIGVASARIESSGTASIGFGLSPEHWGKGYVVEAMRELMRFMQSEYQVTRFYAETLRDNEAAIKVLSQLGLSLASVQPKQFYFKQQSWDGVTYQFDSLH